MKILVSLTPKLINIFIVNLQNSIDELEKINNDLSYKNGHSK